MVPTTIFYPLCHLHLHIAAVNPRQKYKKNRNSRELNGLEISCMLSMSSDITGGSSEKGNFEAQNHTA